MKVKPKQVIVVMVGSDPVAVFRDEPAAREHFCDQADARFETVRLYEYKVVAGLRESGDR